MKKPTAPSKKPAAPTPGSNPKTALPKPPVSDTALFMSAGIAALKQRVIQEEAPKLMENATVMGLKMAQVATIIAEVKIAMDRNGLHIPEDTKELRVKVADLLGNPKPKKTPKKG